jgi:hypothetical protein
MSLQVLLLEVPQLQCIMLIVVPFNDLDACNNKHTKDTFVRKRFIATPYEF